MKRSKKLYTLLGVLAVLLAATVGVLNYEEKKEEIENSGEVIIAVREDDVTELSWEYNSNSLAFYKDSKWFYEGDDAFPVDADKIADLMSCFIEWEASFVIENVEDYGQYGLENPECVIRLVTEEQSYEIKLGDFSTMDSERYVSIGDGNVYLMADDPAEDYDIALSDLIKHDQIPDIENATGITFAGTVVKDGRYGEIALEEASATYSEEDLHSMNVNGEKAALDSANVENYLLAIEGLGLGSFKTYSATEEELEECGLNDPELIITVAYPEEDEDGETPTEQFVISVGRNAEDVAKAEKNRLDEDGENSDSEDSSGSDDSEADSADDTDTVPAYVRIGESPIIYEITESEYESLMASSYDDLRHQEIYWGGFDIVKEVMISLDGESYVITAEGKDDERTYQLNGEEVSISSVQSALEAITAKEFTNEAADGKEEISLTIQLEHDNVKEVKLTFYRHDGSTCLAVVDGEPEAYVDRGEVVELVEAVNELVLK